MALAAGGAPKHSPDESFDQFAFSPVRVHAAGLAALAGWGALSWVSHTTAHPLGAFLLVQAWQWAIFLWMYREIQRGAASRWILVLLGWAVAFRLCGGMAVPLMEDDYFRFLWDGYRCVTTGNPYDQPPSNFFGDPAVPERFEAVLDQINYPDVRTIYGPVCQFLFGAAYLIAPAHLWAWKVWVIGFDLGLLGLATALARRRHAATLNETSEVARVALILGWAPLMVFESSFNAHPDIVGVAFLALALWWQPNRPVWMGVALALAAGTKIFALLLVPFLLRRDFRGWLAFTFALAALYLPFWLHGSAADLGGLAAYAGSWEFNSSVFAVVQWLLEPQAARFVCSGLFVLAWFALLIRHELRKSRDPTFEDGPPGLVILGLFFLLSATLNPWYLLWLAPFLVERNSWTALAAWALISMSYLTGLNLGDPSLSNFQHPGWVRPIEYGAIALVGAWELNRCRLNARRQLRSPNSKPHP